MAICSPEFPCIENTPPMDSSYIDLIIAGFEAQFGEPVVPFPVIPTGVITSADVMPGTVPASGYVVDAASGVNTLVVPDDSGIPPLLPNAAGSGSIVNPAWVEHLYQKQTAKVVNASHYIPPPDTVTIYSGPGEGPTWADVYAWTTAEQRRHMTFVLDTSPVTGAELQASIDAAIGSTIKAMGGMVDQSVELTALIGRALSQRLDALQLATYKGVIHNAEKIDLLQRQVAAILELAIPSLQAQITNETHNRRVDVDRHSEADRQYVRDVWVRPLRSDLDQEVAQRKLADQSIIQRVPSIVRSLLPELGLASAATVAGIAAKVGTLEKEAAECGRPMCDYLGPKSPLGNILKAIKWAALLALLVELGGLTADDINGIVTTFALDVNRAMVTLDDLFVGGGATIAHAIASAAGELV